MPIAGSQRPSQLFGIGFGQRLGKRKQRSEQLCGHGGGGSIRVCFNRSRSHCECAVPDISYQCISLHLLCHQPDWQYALHVTCCSDASLSFLGPQYTH